jgi:hypothetical protein
MDDSLSGAAVLALGRIGSSEALGVLAAMLRRSLNDEDLFAMCVSAIGEALEQQPDERTLEEIDEWNVLRSPDASDVHLRLLKVLNNDHGHAAWLVDPVGIKGAAADVIRALKLRPLYGALIRAGRDPALREHLRFCIVSIGSEMASALAIGIFSPDRNVRLLACQCVGVLALRDVIPQVERLLYDRDDEIRAAAVHATSRVNREAAVSGLATLLDDPSDTVREAVVACLRQMDAEAVTRALIAAPLASVEARELALEIMGASPHPSQRTFVRSHLPPDRGGEGAGAAGGGGDRRRPARAPRGPRGRGAERGGDRPQPNADGAGARALAPADLARPRDAHARDPLARRAWGLRGGPPPHGHARPRDSARADRDHRGPRRSS